MWTAIITVGLQLLSWILERSALSAEAKKRFYEFVKQAGQEIRSVKLYESAEKQLQYFRSHAFEPEPGQVVNPTDKSS